MSDLHRPLCRTFPRPFAGKRARLALWFTPAPASKLAATPLPPGTPWTHHELAAARKLWQLEVQRAATAGASSSSSSAGASPTPDDAHHLLALYTVLLPGRTAEELAALLGSSEFAAYRERLEQRGAAPQATGASTPPAKGTDQLADLAWGIRKLASARAHLDAVFGAPPGAADHAATAPGPDRAVTATAAGPDRAVVPDRAVLGAAGQDRAAAATAGDGGGADASLAMLDAFADVYRKRSALDALLLGAAPPDAAAPPTL